MLELPELEVMARLLNERIGGRRISGANALHPWTLKTVDPTVDDLIGGHLLAVRRRGTSLVFSLDSGRYLVIQLMLSGRLVWCGAQTATTKATAFRLSLEGGEDLRVIESADVRQASVHVVHDPRDVEAVAQSGVEPLTDEFSRAYLAGAVHGKRRQIKHLLLDPSIVAGIGTAYADEILFAAKLSPIRYAATLTEEEIAKLHEAIRAVLSFAVDQIEASAGGATLTPHERLFARVYGRTGLPCLACATRIAEIRYAQTKTYYCPSCQTQGTTS
jgi:formamidopyrimidine-DNA glycosylase